MDIQENTIYTKYQYLVPKHSKISKKEFHEIFQEYVKHPERQTNLMNKLKKLSIKKGKLYKRTNKKSSKNKKSKKRRRN
jgi:DNA-directed RNA polymerase subunit H (RpoH/RPB5)